MNKKKWIIVISFLVIIISILIIYITANKSFVDENGYYKKMSTINSKTASYKNPPIPQNFKIVETNNAIWNNTEIDYEKGLIIEDTEGNQFVWIPVDNKNVTLGRKNFANGVISDVATNKPIDRIYYGEESSFSCLYKYNKSESEYKYSVNYFIDSVKKHGGFYISRYEIGDILATEERKNNSEGKICSKPGCFPYTYISRDEALEKSINMYSSNSSVVSSLVNSYAWDTTLQFVSNSSKEYLSNSINSNTALLKTGESNDVVCNIYDLSGNVSEWSTEYSDNAYYHYLSPYVQRGENYQSKTINPTVRQYNGEDVENKYIGFRIILYFFT